MSERDRLRGRGEPLGAVVESVGSGESQGCDGNSNTSGVVGAREG